MCSLVPGIALNLNMALKTDNWNSEILKNLSSMACFTANMKGLFQSLVLFQDNTFRERVREWMRERMNERQRRIYMCVCVYKWCCNIWYIHSLKVVSCWLRFAKNYQGYCALHLSMETHANCNSTFLKCFQNASILCLTVMETQLVTWDTAASKLKHSAHSLVCSAWAEEQQQLQQSTEEDRI